MKKRSRYYPVVAIVGRANVGKSTLWNRLTETERAIVSKTPHTTRDRNFGLCLWRGIAIEVVDTGGLDAEQGTEIGRGILRQAELAIQESDLVLFLVDAKTGAMPQDKDLARAVRRHNPKIILVANKIDDPKHLTLTSMPEMYGLGLGEAHAASAVTGRGVGDLLDAIYEELARQNRPPQPVETEESLRLVIMGRPNVGKSSLMNSILGEERVIVSAMPHTTREPQDTTFEWQEKKVTLVDTAGMRRRAKIERGIEEAGIERNREALMKADIALLILDATEGPSGQDQHLAGLLKNAGRGVILVANKWDLVEHKKTWTANEYELEIRRAFPFLTWAPIIFISAKTGQRAEKVLDLAFIIQQERERQIAYNALQRLLKIAIARHKPAPDAGPKAPRIYDAVQIGVKPPIFEISVVGDKIGLHESWLRYFENRLREKFGFSGTPIIIKSRNVPAISIQPSAISIRTAEGGKLKAAKLKPAKPKHPWARKRRPIGRKGGRY